MNTEAVVCVINNVISMLASKISLEASIEQLSSKPHIIVVAETWLTNPITIQFSQLMDKDFFLEAVVQGAGR